jgi:hypothetical protein
MFSKVCQYNFEAERNKIWNDPGKVRVWAVASLDSTGNLARSYRKFAADLDGDLGRAAASYRLEGIPEQDTEIVRLQFLYELRFIWRFLLRRYAFAAAWKAHRAQLMLGEPWPWRLWRLKDLLLLRVAVGVLLGFLVLSSSSGLVELLAKAQSSCYFTVWMLGSQFLIWAFALAEVQRRVGRRPWSSLLARSAWIWLAGLVYGLLGAALQYWVGRSLGFDLTPRLVLLCGTTAVFLSFLFQHFWQEQSIGDPL